MRPHDTAWAPRRSGAARTLPRVSRRPVHSRTAGVLLLLSPVVWGATFPATKVALEDLSPWTFMGWSRGLGAVAAVALLLVWRPPREAWTWALVPAGLLLGALLTVGYALQTVGIEETTATNAGFITTLYVVFAPLGAALIARRAPGRVAVACVALSLSGLALLSARGTGMQEGDLLVLGGAIGFAGHIVAVDLLVARLDPLALGAAQVVGAALIQAALAVPDGAQPEAAAELWHILLLCGALGSGVGFFIQVVGQSAMSPARASVLLASEALFAALAAAVWLDERLSAREWAGVATMMAAIVLSEAHAWRSARVRVDAATAA
jgi:drug/metabolite transporter (DMT)-like permease